MDDHRARHMLDALADLFLTGVQPVTADSAPPATAAAAAPPPTPAASGPTPGVNPIRLPPKLVTPAPAPGSASAGSAPAPGGETARSGDTAVAVEPEPPAPIRFADHLPAGGDSAPRPRLASKPRFEAVMLGNLPGFGGPWLNQYAFDLAQRLGPIAVLHLDDEQVDADVVCSMEQRKDVRQMCTALRREPADLLRLVQTLSEPGELGIAAWLIHLPTPLTDAARRVARDVDRWTVLCGCDDVSVVSAYRTFKQLLEGDPHRDRRKPGVMVMGCEEEQAQATAQKLNHAGRSFLHVPIELLGLRKRMVPVNVESLGSFPQKPELWQAIGSVLGERFIGTWSEAVAPTEPAEPATPAVQVTPAAATPVDAPLEASVSVAPAPPQPPPQMQPPAAEPVIQTPARVAAVVEPEPEPEPEPQAQPEPQAPAEAPPLVASTEVAEPIVRAQPPRSWAMAGVSPEVLAEAPRRQPPSRAPRVAPAAAASAAPAASSAVAEPVAVGDQPPDLLSLITDPGDAEGIAGGVALAAQCPRHPDTQLALDAAGRLHLLRRHQQAQQDLRVALTDLLDAKAWVVEHLQLLQLTHQGRMDTQATPRLHLFTDQAKAAVKLAPGAGQLVKLRLLQPVRVQKQTAWVCVELH